MDMKTSRKFLFTNLWRIFGGIGAVLGTLLGIHSVYTMLSPEAMPIYKGSVSSYITSDGKVNNPFVLFVMNNLDRTVYLDVYFTDDNLVCNEREKYAACVSLSEVAGSESVSLVLKRESKDAATYSIFVKMEGINKTHGGNLVGYWTHADGACGDGVVRAEMSGFFRLKINRVSYHQIINGWITKSDTTVEKATIEKASSLKGTHIGYNDSCTPVRINEA